MLPRECEHTSYDDFNDYYEREDDNEEDQEKWYTTGEAARLLGIGFITLKRWIYDGKVEAEQTESGRYHIYQRELDRLQAETKDFHAEAIKMQLAGKKVAYMREMQVCLENEYSHFDTATKLKRLAQKGELKNYQRKSGTTTYSWFHLPDIEEKEAEVISDSKTALIELLHSHPKVLDVDGTHYFDYSEYLVERSLLEAGFTIASKDSYYFNGISVRTSSGPGRPSDLDFIVRLPKKETWLGISIKNRLESVRNDDVSLLTGFCDRLRLKPLLITRAAGPTAFLPVSERGGWIVVSKRYMLQPEFPRDKFKEILQMGMPIAVYRRAPGFLTKALVRAAERIG